MTIYNFIPWEYTCSRIHNPSAPVRNEAGKFKSNHNLPKKFLYSNIWDMDQEHQDTNHGHSWGRFQGCSSDRIPPGEFASISDTVCKKSGGPSQGREKHLSDGFTHREDTYDMLMQAKQNVGA